VRGRGARGGVARRSAFGDGVDSEKNKPHSCPVNPTGAQKTRCAGMSHPDLAESLCLRHPLKPTLAEPPPLGSFDGIALDEPLVHVDGDCDPIPGMPSVVQVIAVLEVNDIHIIVFVPVV